jgi:hypothetical protein
MPRVRGSKEDEAPTAHGARGAESSSERLGTEALWRPAPGALRSFWSRVFGAEVSEPFGALGAEALGSRYRRLFGAMGASGFEGSGCRRLHVGSRYRRFPGARGPGSLNVQHPRGSQSKFWEGSKARAGRQPRRRGGRAPCGQRAGGATFEPAIAFARWKTRAENAMSVCSR